MSQSSGRSSAALHLAYSDSTPARVASNAPRSDNNDDDAPLPSYLARHIHLGFSHDDVAALITSIDSSQDRSASTNKTSTLAHLPAELLLQILEHVPVDYVLDWRLVCRGFRDAIDGRVLYRCLQRTELVGYLGSRHARPMEELDEEQYEAVHLLEAQFQHVEWNTAPAMGTSRPVWSGTHAVFKIAEDWYRAFRQIGGAEARGGHAIDDADPQWDNVLDRLELQRAEEGFGTLRWCIRLDHAVLDLDFPCEKGRLHFDVDVNLHTGLIRVAWKDMLVRFLKTERALRILFEQKTDSPTTFSHDEDCLRCTRRTQLIRTLTPTKPDNHILWALRLLPPLFGTPPSPHTTPLTPIENDAVSTLLLLRRTASLSAAQLTYLSNLHTSYLAMESALLALDDIYAEYKAYMTLPGFHMNVLLPAHVRNAQHVPRNPVAWTDELRASVEALVGRWKGQEGVVQRVSGLLEASCEAMALPDDSFDEVGSDF